MQNVQNKLKICEKQAISYFESKDFENAEASCKKGLIIFNQSENIMDFSILPFKAKFYYLLGKIYQNLHNIKGAIEMYLDSLNCYSEFFDNSEIQYLPDLFETLYSIGELYNDNGKYKKAINTYSQALFIYSKLNKSDANKSLLILAKIHTELGHLYLEFKRIKEAKNSYSSAINAYKILSKKDPEKYNPYFKTLTQILQVISSDF